jgi:hypothetical protein
MKVRKDLPDPLSHLYATVQPSFYQDMSALLHHRQSPPVPWNAAAYYRAGLLPYLFSGFQL